MSYLTRYEPFDDFFKGFFVRPFAFPTGSGTDVNIKLDVKEAEKEFFVEAEIPGVKKEDIAVEIEGNEVTIAAELKRETAPKEGEKWLRTERFHGKMGRRFALPQEIDEAKANAKFADGVLELALPKKQAAAGRKVVVQ